jgi:hypothetical protein
MLQCMSPLLAHSGHRATSELSPLSDPKRTFICWLIRKPKTPPGIAPALALALGGAPQNIAHLRRGPLPAAGGAHPARVQHIGNGP